MASVRGRISTRSSNLPLFRVTSPAIKKIKANARKTIKNGHSSFPPGSPAVTMGSKDQVTVDILKALLSENESKVTSNLSAKLDSGNKELKAILETQNSRISVLESSSSHLQQSIAALKEENDILWRQVTKNNLIFSGVPDNPNEANSVLSKLIRSFIVKHTNLNVEIESAFRLGKFLSGKTRSIKVAFLNVRDRDAIWKSRNQFRPPLYINEDLPKSVQKEHTILKQKKRELILQGYKPEDIKINYNRRFLQFLGLVYYVQNDQINIALPSTSQNSSNSTQNPSTNTRKRKNLNAHTSQTQKRPSNSSQKPKTPFDDVEDFEDMDDSEENDPSFLGDGSPNQNQTV